LLDEDALGLQEDLAKATLLEQSSVAPRRQIIDGQVSEPVAPRGRLLLEDRLDDVTAIASDAGALYGGLIEEFTRVWIQAGPHALFVIDREDPVRGISQDEVGPLDVLFPFTPGDRRIDAIPDKNRGSYGNQDQDKGYRPQKGDIKRD